MSRKPMMIVSVAISALLFAGCAHGIMRGSVAMKSSENEAHVCLGNKEAKIGNRVAAFRNDCTTKGGGKASTCKRVNLGEGTVTELLNEHYSVVRFDSGVAFDEGTYVEIE